MKAMVGFLFFMLFLAAFALSMLQGRQAVGLSGGGIEMVGIWAPTALGASRVADDSELRISIQLDGNVSGFGGCNSFLGTLEPTSDGVVFGSLSIGRKRCADDVMQTEQEFVDALSASTSIARTDRGLQLLNADRLLLAELRAVASADESR